MKVVVTGASGYLGGSLCRALLNDGHQVRAFVRRTSDVSQIPSSPQGKGGLLELVYGDVTDYPSLLLAFSGCDVVFHAAALVEPWLPDPSQFFTVNVGGLKNVLQAFKESGTIQKIIYTSSFFALGPTNGRVVDETQLHREKFFCSEYEKSKVEADKIARQAASSGVPMVLLYPGVIYGSGKLTAGNILARIMIERFNGRLPGYVGHGKLSFCHVDDVAAGHVLSMHKGHVGQRYLLTGDNASLEYIFDAAAIITQTRRPLFHIPIWVIYIYGWISVAIAHITGNLPLISYPTVAVMKQSWEYSCDKAKNELGYAPRSLDQGLGEMLRWLKEEGLIKY
ncbi:NAD(P)-binding Rossmann-fold superfamily protein [Wolffia australiana]